MGQTLLQIGAAISDQGKLYYKLAQLLQTGAIITNWGITNGHPVVFKLGYNLLKRSS